MKMTDRLSVALEIVAESRQNRDDAQAALERHVATALAAGGTLRLIQAHSGLAQATIIRIREDAGLVYTRGSYDEHVLGVTTEEKGEQS